MFIMVLLGQWIWVIFHLFQCTPDQYTYTQKHTYARVSVHMQTCVFIIYSGPSIISAQISTAVDSDSTSKNQSLPQSVQKLTLKVNVSIIRLWCFQIFLKHISHMIPVLHGERLTKLIYSPSCPSEPALLWNPTGDVWQNVHAAQKEGSGWRWRAGE